MRNKTANLLMKIKSLILPAKRKMSGIILFESVQEVIIADELLSKNNLNTRLIAPPVHYRIGCDLAIEFDLLEEELVRAVVKQYELSPLRFISVNERLSPVERGNEITEIDGFTMSKTGNMKITADKDFNIVNISGGGCPDTTFVAQNILNKSIFDAKEPMEIGASLCTYMLQIAFTNLKECAYESKSK